MIYYMNVYVDELFDYDGVVVVLPLLNDVMWCLTMMLFKDVWFKDVLYKDVIFEDCCIWVVSLH